MAPGVDLLPFRHVFIGFAMAVAATALLAVACVVIPGLILRSRFKRAALPA